MKNNLPDKPFLKLIKKYPHICATVALVLGLTLLVLPIPLRAKMRVIVLSAVIGFLVAVGWYYFSNQKKYGPKP